MTDHPGLSGSCFCLLRTPARHQQPTQARRWRLPSSGLHRQDRAGAVACGRNPREERAPGRRTRAPVRRIPPGAAPCRKDSGANGPATARRRGGARPRVWIAAGARGARPDSCSMGRRRPPRPPAARFWISLPCVFCTLRPVGSPPIAGIPGPTEARRGLAGWRTCCQGCPARERPARSQRGFGALARPVSALPWARRSAGGWLSPPAPPQRATPAAVLDGSRPAPSRALHRPAHGKARRVSSRPWAGHRAHGSIFSYIGGRKSTWARAHIDTLKRPLDPPTGKAAALRAIRTRLQGSKTQH